MATKFESIYEKFLMQVDDYELGIIEDYMLSHLCFSYLDKARALYFPQCEKDLTDVTVNEVTFINGVRIEPLGGTEDPTDDSSVNNGQVVGGSVAQPTQPTQPSQPIGVSSVISTPSIDVDAIDIDTEKEDELFVLKEGYFNFELTPNEQFILALGMKKAWLSSKKYSADLMSKDIGDRDYKATQGFNYIKELRSLDIELEEEIRKNAVQYTYNIDDLTSGW